MKFHVTSLNCKFISMSNRYKPEGITPRNLICGRPENNEHILRHPNHPSEIWVLVTYQTPLLRP